MTWSVGEADIRRLINATELQSVIPDRAAADDLIMQARQHLISAATVVESDPEGAFQLAYDAARKSLSAILEAQGLRATARGGHVAIEEASRAQLGTSARPQIANFQWMRRTRNQTEYRSDRGPAADGDDAREAIAFAAEIVEIPGRVMDVFGTFAV